MEGKVFLDFENNQSGNCGIRTDDLASKVKMAKNQKRQAETCLFLIPPKISYSTAFTFTSMFPLVALE
jgi:hypothetical protein